jgi:hypothetical protein
MTKYYVDLWDGRPLFIYKEVDGVIYIWTSQTNNCGYWMATDISVGTRFSKEITALEVLLTRGVI